ncbi:MAG: competence/damage-inducible protein A [Oscillospiraceae bacterium]|nr:competence/damage-inducible protein A [Oscillospiraceae bacterium]
MNAEIICVGTELLLGDVVNTNAADIAKGLAAIGINVYHHTVVGDNPKRLEQCLSEAFSRSKMVILTGGLGPTYDDLTKETVARHFGRKLVMDEASLKAIESYFARSNRIMTENNRKQAMMPEGCIILANPNGTAPGCIIESENGEIAVMMPGPPREMRPMFSGPVTEYLEKRFGGEGALFSKTINFFGIGESALEAALHDVIVDMTNPTVAPYSKPQECQLRVTARAADKAAADALIEPVVKMICEKFPDKVYGFDYRSLPQAVVDVFTKKQLTISTAESLTGGMIAQRMVEIPGASAVLMGGIVSYTNEVKHDVLGVSQATLDEFGAVSAECALEMARGARKLTKSDIAVSATGVAGPAGGTEKTPVGRVYVACVSEKAEQVRELNLARGRADDRETIRGLSAANAYDMALKMAKKI